MINSPNTFIIAEAGVNHNGSLDLAKRLIDVAKDAGADAVKFQTFKATSLVSADAPKAEYQNKTTSVVESQFEMIKKLELSEDDHQILIDYCIDKKIEFLSTPFDSESLSFLINRFNMRLVKIPSGEITNAPLLLEVALTEKPVILSTGMSTLGEIEDALGVLAFGYLKEDRLPSLHAFREARYSFLGQKLLKEKVSILHCTTEYPAPLESVNLKVLDTLKQAFNLPIGFSDHTEGITVAIGAVARGATIIEKHFTTDRTLPGPDHRASLEPEELTEMISGIRAIEKAIGITQKYPQVAEVGNLSVARKSLVASKQISIGELFSAENLTCKRPGNGTSPFHYWDIVGRKAQVTFQKDEPIKFL
jgi:N-acetylneuraminate synthase